MAQSILISGSSGFIGRYLSNLLTNHGYDVIALSRDPSHNKISYEEIDRRSYFAVIHLAGENIFSIWTKKKKKEIWDSRIQTTRNIVQSLKNSPPEIFLSASAIGYYGDRGEELLTEESSQGEGFLAQLCQEWEKEARRLDKSIVTSLRFGMVLAENGGALSSLIPMVKCGLGAVMGTGKQHISWISLEDLGRAVLFLLQNPLEGAVNFTSLEPLSQKRFMKQLCKHYKRPLFMRIPSFLLKLLPGGMGREIFLTSAKALPEVLEERGFTFIHPSLDKFLNSLPNG